MNIYGKASPGLPESLLLPGDAIGYARKSTASENASKSIEDQAAEIMEIAQDYGIPLTEADMRIEQIGHGGDEWWVGGGGSGLADDNSPQGRTRPMLTQIMKDVVKGKVRCIIVWSQDRLWRSVGICDKLIDVFMSYGVQLYDRNGPVDLHTPEGRQTVRNNAVAAAAYREMCAVNSPRGIKRSLKKGIVCTDSNILGFRSAGRYSRQVIPVPEELEVVRRIHRLFDAGEEGSGPLSYPQIAEKLMDEGYQWTPDLIERRAVKRNTSTRHIIYDWQIKKVLTDCRYQGRQPQYGQEWDCPAYLVDGQPAVDIALFERNQAKIRSLRRVGSAGQNKRALTGLMRCGLCGQGLHVGGTSMTMANGEKRQIPYWKNVKSETWCWCTHKLPHLRETTVDAYIDTIVAPLLLAEIRERATANGNNGLADEEARLEREISEVQRKLSQELPQYVGHVSPACLGNMEQQLHAQIADLRHQLAAVYTRLQQLQTHDLERGLEDLVNLDPAARRDAIRAVLHWVAVLPSNAPRERCPRWGRLRPATHAGWLVFLTSWGTYHTAMIERTHTGETDHRQLTLRPATPQEVVGTVADFPAPADFVAGLIRAYQGRKYDYDPLEIMPGYLHGGATPPVAEFATEETVIQA